ncbi:MAG: DUF5661 family protein [Thermoplasmatales archaeon]
MTSLFKKIEELRKSLAEIAIKTTAGRHPQGPGVDASSMSQAKKPTQPKNHVRADTMTHMDIKLEKTAHEDQIPGGLADKKHAWNFDIKALMHGIEVEMEHTSDPKIAKEIAMDHLTEDPNYYKKLDEMEKADAPTRHGQLHPTKPYIAQMHSDGRLAYYNKPEIAAKHDADIAAHKDAYLATLPAEHRPLISKFIDHVSKMYTRHAIVARDKLGGKPVPRARHIRGLVTRDPNYSIKVNSPDSLTMTVHSRHGEGDLAGQSTYFNYSSAKGLEKSSDKYLRRKWCGKARKPNKLNDSRRFDRVSVRRGSSSGQSMGNDSGSVRGTIKHVRSAGHCGYSGGRRKVIKSSSNIPVDIPHISSIAVINGNKLLMGKRHDNQRWTLPGGHLNAGEDPIDGAYRELMEEARIQPQDMYYMGSKNVVGNDGKNRMIHAFTCFSKYSTDTELDPDEEVQNWQWIDCSKGLPEEVKKNLHSPKNVVLKFLGLLNE